MFYNKKIIIVGESKAIIQQFNSILIETDSEVFEATCLKDLYHIIESHNGLIDLIIFDISLEYEEGLNLTQQFKANSSYKGIPLIITSVYSSEAFVIAAKELGIVDFIKKPFEKDGILDRLTYVLGNKI